MIYPAKQERLLSYLADDCSRGRSVGTLAHQNIGKYIREHFEQYGLQPFQGHYYQHFKCDSTKVGRNIVGYIPSIIPSDEYIIISAHYDHIGALNGFVYNGADDNASGVTALMNLAEMFGSMHKAKMGPDKNIIFVAFDAKEMSMAGSQAMWDLIKRGQLKDPLSGKTITKDKIAFMVNIDQIGSTLEPINKDRKDFIIMLGGNSFRHSYDNLLVNVNEMYDINLDLGFTYYGSENFTKMFYRLSDQRIFVDNKIPAILFTSGITMNTNKTKDRIETLDMNVLQKRIYLMYHWVEKML